MAHPWQLKMGAQAPHRNRYLFSDHYLENILPRDPRWGEALAEAEAFLTWLQAHYAEEQEQLTDYNEDQLRDHWFTPIFAQLGHTFEREAAIPGLDAYIKKPDYVFFPDERARQKAASAQGAPAYTAEALAVGEVKRWDTPLGKKKRGGGPSFADQNPSFQIDTYIRITAESSDRLDWGILTNGRLWRIVHRETSHRLQIYYEVDLIHLLEEGDPGLMRYFTRFFAQTAFRPDAQGRVFLDDVLAGSRAYALALEEDLEENAYEALHCLMQGFLDLAPNTLGPDHLQEIYDQSLYLLYRLLFILYGESRGLLPMDNELYREYYSLSRITQDIADGRMARVARTTMVWRRLETLFRIIGGDDAELNRSLDVPRYDGGLFDPQQHPFLEEKEIDDAALIRALDLVSRRETETGREFVDYRTLGVRHLGSIYEGLLEYQPRYAAEPMVAIRNGNGERWVKAAEAPADAHIVDQRAAGEIYLATDRGERKATGSYYTPQYIVEYIVAHTIDPLVAQLRESVGGQALVDAILDLKILDPAMGSGHFLVEATEHLAIALATDPSVTTETAEATSEEDLTFWKRRVVERCIYGVDKNPLAVELAKLSLWLATFAADKPLGFLDHHLKCGDSLIGARVDALGEAPPVMLTKKQLRERAARYETGARQANLFEMRLIEKLPTVMGRILEITAQESDSYDTVRAKNAANQAVRKLKAPFEAVADLWTSAYFGNEFTTGAYDAALMAIGQPEALMDQETVRRAQALAAKQRFFHWELAFPEVFYDEQGQRHGDEAGFDAVISNPPYFRISNLSNSEKYFLQKHYKEIYDGGSDIFYFFIDRGISLLNTEKKLGFIVSRYFLDSKSAELTRKRVMQCCHIEQIVDFQGLRPFPSVSIQAIILVIQEGQTPSIPTLIVKLTDENITYEQIQKALYDMSSSVFHRYKSELGAEGKWEFHRLPVQNLLEKIRSSAVELQTIGEVVQSMQTGRNDIFVLTKEQAQEHQIEEELLRPLVKSGDVRRYYLETNTHLLLWTEGIELSNYPGAQHYLEPFREILASRYDIKSRKVPWWFISNPRNADKFENIIPRILTPYMSPESRFYLDEFGYFNDGGDLRAIFPLENTVYDLSYLISILNASLGEFYHQKTAKRKDAGKFEYFGNVLEQFPIRRIDFTTPAEERAALLAEGQAKADAAIQEMATSRAFDADTPMGRAMLAQANVPALAFVAARLKHDPEQADVIHDLLAQLAKRMIAMHKERQTRIEDFWLDLEGVTDADTFEALREHGKWEASLWKAKACRPFVDAESRATRHLDESLSWDEAGFKAFVKMLAGRVPNLSDIVRVYRRHQPDVHALVRRIAAADYLIDQIVYRLYGLMEDEIAVVES